MVTVPTNQEKPRSEGSEGISRRHVQGDRQDISTQLSIGKVVLPAKEVSLRNMSIEKEIDDIDDVEDMFKTMASLGVSTKGLRTLDEMKQRLKETLKQSERKSSWTAKEVS
ncbi:uncharacterized protein LOC110047070 isoform X2 [Orbicella faveolata]|uniref:uncharacterized protein LOC110047070 isoform X1 n=1 Tax=Orbicella faveolata TaxID=48498 RepID=UPI0009E21C6F|nr:uncharacterized protein LOC110047070 isoform X1 [Orbicella faveolata]XP_020608463.1 uncharacterized protein LOC110047070 isoform X2 [Orbicella faveolata]